VANTSLLPCHIIAFVMESIRRRRRLFIDRPIRRIRPGGKELLLPK
jgi:hypothetical protein